ncbi:hypothetical protein [Nocardia sp. NBC_01327]
MSLLLHRHGCSWQMHARRAVERDDVTRRWPSE